MTVVTLIQLVGLILVIALLTLPAAISWQYANSLLKMIVVSIVVGCFITVAGIYLSFLINLPTGPTIILVAGVAFLLSTLFKYFYK